MSIVFPHDEERSHEAGSPAAGSRGGTVNGDLACGSVRRVRNEKLFGLGEPRACLYYIEKGVVAICRRASGRQDDIVEFAFAGDVLGYGLFDHHTSWAQAIGEVHIRSVPMAALDRMVRNDQRAFDRYAATLERDFQDRRNELIRAERRLVHRLAALLLALSRQNTLEGRDPHLVTDELECGAAATWLRTDVGELMDALRELEQSRLIERCPPNGLRLSDVAGLTRLSGELATRASPPLAQTQD
jgi:CRP/FNR family transcriptional regulator, anaerobic regulatory protein